MHMAYVGDAIKRPDGKESWGPFQSTCSCIFKLSVTNNNKSTGSLKIEYCGKDFIICSGGKDLSPPDYMRADKKMDMVRAAVCHSHSV